MQRRRRPSGRAGRAVGAWACVLLTLGAWLAPAAAASPARSATAGVKPLVLAHYYIWFDRTSWNRAKQDYPLAGRYSSDDVSVMREQVEEAKSAGIDGFIVSWKSTPQLNARLKALTDVAREEKFKLAITYQGLTFDKVNVPPDRIGEDLDYFTDRFGRDPVFDIFGKPLVVLTGTPGLSRDAVQSITEKRRSVLTILATEKNVQGYERVADLVDGDLYYWSSVNPDTYPTFGAKLSAMGDAVRRHGGLWIAPAAPGFNARMVGGESNVDRAGGQTLRREWAAAVASKPTAIGLISWNEYSENTYIEPSEHYGTQYLEEVSSLTGSGTPGVSDFDSSGPSGAVSPWRPIVIFSAAGLLVALCTVVAIRRRRGGREHRMEGHCPVL